MKELSFTARAIDQIAFIFGVTVVGALAMLAVVAAMQHRQRRRATRFHERAMRALEPGSWPPAELPAARVTSRGRRRSRSCAR